VLGSDVGRSPGRRVHRANGRRNATRARRSRIDGYQTTSNRNRSRALGRKPPSLHRATNVFGLNRVASAQRRRGDSRHYMDQHGCPALRRSEQQVRALNANLEQRVQLETANRGCESRPRYWNWHRCWCGIWTIELCIGLSLRNSSYGHTDFPELRAQVEARLLRTDRWDGELVRRKHNGEKLVIAGQEV